MPPTSETNTAKFPSISAHSVITTESTPLLQKKTIDNTQRKWRRSAVYRVLITAFLVSLSFGITQVPLLYVFGLMTCDEYYRHHPVPPLGTPEWESRCRLPAIEASTARSIALLGGGTTLFGVMNLFITGWAIKSWGVKRALLVSIFWPAIRLLVQNIGVEKGAGTGIIIIQCSQITTIIGGPAGYLLALNSFATELVLPSERTATLGRLSGVAMFGTAFGFLSGGILGDWMGISAPFRVTLILFCVSTIYSVLALPTIKTSKELEKKASKSVSAFFEPLKMFLPRKWVLRNGVIQREYGVLLLGAGAFLAIFATGYIPTLLQMYSTDVFDFGTTENSGLIFVNFVIRAAFLTFAFPAIIDYGRARMKKKTSRQDEDSEIERSPLKGQEIDDIEAIAPTEPSQLATTALPPGQANADEPELPARRKSHSQDNVDDSEESFAFDLLYTRYSLLADGALTLLAAFTTKGWHMFVVAAVIPLAAGTGSAAKGTMLQMCTPEQKTDALSAISLLEAIARLSTVSLFGMVFAGFMSIGQPRWTFVMNGAVAAIGFLVLVFARFPPPSAVRYVEDEHAESEDTSTDRE